MNAQIESIQRRLEIRRTSLENAVTVLKSCTPSDYEIAAGAAFLLNREKRLIAELENQLYYFTALVK